MKGQIKDAELGVEEGRATVLQLLIDLSWQINFLNHDCKMESHSRKPEAQERGGGDKYVFLS